MILRGLFVEIDENAIRDIVSNILKGSGDDSETSLETRRAMIKAMRQVAEDNAEQFARLAVDETGMGWYEDKIRKNQLAGRMTPGVEDLDPSSFSDDHGLTITERASYGVIGAIAPSTNPTETIINNSISMVSASKSGWT